MLFSKPGLVAYVGDRAPLSCPTSNLKTLWYRTTNSSTGNCQRPLIYKDTVLCEQLSQGSNVEGSFRHRLSFLSSNGGRLQTLVIGNVEKSDAGKYTCIDSVHWRLVCQLDLFVLGWFRHLRNVVCTAYCLQTNVVLIPSLLYRSRVLYYFYN